MTKGCCLASKQWLLFVTFEKFIVGQFTMVFVPHQVLTLLESKGGYWLMAERVGKYHTILSDNPNVTLKNITALNSVTLLLDSEGDSVLQQYCLKIID